MRATTEEKQARRDYRDRRWESTPRPKLFPFPRLAVTLILSVGQFGFAVLRHRWSPKSPTPQVGKDMLIFAVVTIIIYMVIYALEWSWNYVVLAPMIQDQKSQKQLKQQAEEISSLNLRSRNVDVRDWIGEWGESERQFVELENSDVFAQLFDGVWAVRSDRDSVTRDKVQAACEMAGSRLFNSPGMTLSERVKSQVEHWQRWLCFLQETEGLNRTFSGDKDSGYIDRLAQVSSIACTKCRAKAFG